MALPREPYISVEDYLILDRTSKDVRYEYFDGVLRMLAGGSLPHSRIKVNLTGILNNLLRKSSCYVYDSDARLKLSTMRYVYPDAIISCDPRDQEQHEEIQYPCVVCEVLSPTTEAVDRGKKFLYYRECQSLQEYVMLDSESILIEVYRREEKGWTLYTFGPDDEVVLKSVNISFPVAHVYEKVHLP